MTFFVGFQLFVNFLSSLWCWKVYRRHQQLGWCAWAGEKPGLFRPHGERLVLCVQQLLEQLQYTRSNQKVAPFDIECSIVALFPRWGNEGVDVAGVCRGCVAGRALRWGKQEGPYIGKALSFFLFVLLRPVLL